MSLIMENDYFFHTEMCVFQITMAHKLRIVRIILLLKLSIAHVFVKITGLEKYVVSLF